MRVTTIVLVFAVCVLAAPAEAARWTQSWDPAVVDFDAAVRQDVTARFVFETVCPTEALTSPQVMLSMSNIRGHGAAVLYYHEGEEIFPGTVLALGPWVVDSGVPYLWRIEQSVDLEVERGPNATVGFEVRQSFIRVNYPSDPCPLAESWARNAVEGDAEKATLVLTASALPNITADEELHIGESPGPLTAAFLVVVLGAVVTLRAARGPPRK